MNFKYIETVSVILTVCFIMIACTKSDKFTESELRTMPPTDFRNSIEPGSRVIVKTKDLQVKMIVKRYEGNDYMVGLDEDSEKVVKIAINEINEIEINDEKLSASELLMVPPAVVVSPIVIFPNLIDALIHPFSELFPPLPKLEIPPEQRWGNLYFEGKEVPQNYDEAIRWYTMAAYKGDITSQRRLAICYLESSQDYIKAFAWLTMAVDQGNYQAKLKRYEIAHKMSPEQIAAANELIREIKAKLH